MFRMNMTLTSEKTMPTIHFEYTSNLKIADQVKPFLQEAHHLLVETIKTDLATCRSLIVCHNDYVVGDGDPNNGFIQLSIKMLPGRNDDIKHKLGNILFEKIKNTFKEKINPLTTQIRVYLQETDIKYYYGLKNNDC